MTAAVAVLPFGSQEYHGPHLPAETDTILASHFARRLVDAQRSFALHLAPTAVQGVSPEHLWHASTISITGDTLHETVAAACHRIRCETGTTRFIFLNCHGGNRPYLERECDDLYWGDKETVAVLANPLSLVAHDFTAGGPPDVHAGLIETAVMMAIAPDQVKAGAMHALDPPDGSDPASRWRLGRRGVYWPWTSADPALASDGVIGDPRAATADLGLQIETAALAELEQLLQLVSSTQR